jgi:hypothetical protein
MAHLLWRQHVSRVFFCCTYVDTEALSVFLQLSPTTCLYVLDTSPELYYNLSGMYLENYIINISFYVDHLQWHTANNYEHSKDTRELCSRVKKLCLGRI